MPPLPPPPFSSNSMNLNILDRFLTKQKRRKRPFCTSFGALYPRNSACRSNFTPGERIWLHHFLSRPNRIRNPAHATLGVANVVVGVLATSICRFNIFSPAAKTSTRLPKSCDA